MTHKKLYLLTSLAVSSLLAACGGGSGGGDMNQVPTPIEVNNESPIVDISSPLSGEVLQGSYSITLQGTATDDNGISSLSVSINNETTTALVLSGNNFSAEITLTRDDNTVTVIATDESGLQASAEVTVYYVATGSLDNSFGEDINPADGTADGFVVVNSPANTHDTGTDLLVDNNGTIFVAGFSRQPDYEMILWRLTADGILDTASGFGGGSGFVTLDDPTGNAGGGQNDFAQAIALDANGKILIAGNAHNGTNNDLVIARFDATTGTLDSTFGGDINPVDGSPDGFVVHSLSAGSNENVKAMTIDGNGNILAAGYSNESGSDDMTLWRFTEDGQLDTSFASANGYVTHDGANGNPGSEDNAAAITLDTDGTILITGTSGSNMVLWRYTDDGILDNRFGDDNTPADNSPDGFSTFSAVGSNSGYGLTIDTSGKILVSGRVYSSAATTWDMILWRYNSDGSLDTSFANDLGYTIHASAAGYNYIDSGFGVITDAGGNILVAGHSQGTNSDEDMVVWRYTTDGVLDTTFGGDANPADSVPDGFFFQHDAAGGDNRDSAGALMLDSRGNILVTGYSIGAGTGSDLVVWKLK